MEIIEIFKAPFKGNFSNSKLKMKESIIINFILACVFAITFLITIKTLLSDLSKGSIDAFYNVYKFFGINNLLDTMMVKVFILIVINSVAIVFVFSGIVYIINKLMFKLKISYEECVSTFTYANIIPTAIMPIGFLFSLFSVSLSIVVAIIQIFVLLILTYEGLEKLFIIGKSKLIYSIAITYIVNTGVFAATYYLIIKSMIESSVQNLFK